MWVLLWSLFVTAAGTLATYLYEPTGSETSPGLGTRLGQGLATGFVYLGLGAYPVTAWLGYDGAARVLLTLICVLPLAFLLFRTTAVENLKRDAARVPSQWRNWVWVLPVALVLTRLFSRVLIVDEHGLFTGYDNNLGDVTLHLGLITGFAHGDNFPPQHPEFGGTRMAYPFMADFLVSLAMRNDFNIVAAMLIENVVLAMGLIVIVARFAWLLTGSRAAACISPLILWFSGGLGGLQAWSDWRGSGRGFFDFMFHLPHDYTLMEGYRWGNALTTLFVPQRTILLGLPLAIIAWGLWWQALRSEDEERARRHMTGAGILVAMLPLSHAHSYITSMMVAGGLFLLYPRPRFWAHFFIPALGIAAPQMLWATHGAATQAGSFFGVEFGWDHGKVNPLKFWLLNAGFFIPLWLAALFKFSPERKELLRFHVPYAGLFLLSNTFKLSPWLWDNIKFLLVWFVGSIPLVALLLTRIPRWLAALLLAALMFSGGLDVWRVFTGCEQQGEFDPTQLAFSEQISQKTPPRSLIAAAPIYNSPVEIAGRRLLMGYAGHLWSTGLNYGQREADLREIYAGSGRAAELMRAYGVNYVVVGPQERASFPVNESFFQSYPVAVQIGDYRLVQIGP